VGSQAISWTGYRLGQLRLPLYLRGLDIELRFVNRLTIDQKRFRLNALEQIHRACDPQRRYR
jgi:hypothetical protein